MVLQNPLKCASFWLTVVTWFLCLILVVYMFFFKNYIVVQRYERRCDEEFGVNRCAFIFIATHPKTGLFLVASTGPLFFVITSGLLMNFLFIRQAAERKINVVYSYIGAITFSVTAALAFQYYEEGFTTSTELLGMVLLAVTGCAFLLKGLYELTMCFIRKK